MSRNDQPLNYHLPKKNLPNIILITNHDSGNNMSCAGFPFPTPNLDDLAQKGIRFDNNFCTAPQCSPSRGSFLTGKMPHVNGLMGLTNRGWDLPTSNLTIPKLLKKRGYSTHLIGLQHVHRDANSIGYDTVSSRLKDAPFIGKKVRKTARKFFMQVEKAEIPQPFYAKIGFFEPHRPFFTGIKHRPKKSRVNVPAYLPATDEFRRAIKKFAGSLGALDDSIGHTLSELEKHSFSDNTLIIYTVDHGWAMPRAKCTLYDPGIRTSLIVYWPGKIEGGKVITKLTSGVDLNPTIMELIGLPLDKDESEGMQGKSYAPLLLPELIENGDFSPRDYVMAELTLHDSGYNPVRAIRTEKWKYIRNFTTKVGDEAKLFEIPMDIMGQPSGKSYVENHPEWKQERPSEELYDIETDSLEMNNLANNGKYEEIKNELNGKLMKFLKSTKDPILQGPIKEPEKPWPLLM